MGTFLPKKHVNVLLPPTASPPDDSLPPENIFYATITQQGLVTYQEARATGWRGSPGVIHGLSLRASALLHMDHRPAESG